MNQRALAIFAGAFLFCPILEGIIYEKKHQIVDITAWLVIFALS